MPLLVRCPLQQRLARAFRRTFPRRIPHLVRIPHASRTRPLDELRWREWQLDELVAAGDTQSDAASDELADEQALEIANALDWAAIQRDDEVARSDAGRRGG